MDEIGNVEVERERAMKKMTRGRMTGIDEVRDEMFVMAQRVTIHARERGM